MVTLAGQPVKKRWMPITSTKSPQLINLMGGIMNYLVWLLYLIILIFGQVQILSELKNIPKNQVENQPIQYINQTVLHPEYHCTIYSYYHKTPDKTAIMERPISGYTCAVSKDLIHWLGGKIYIEGIGVRRVNDLMHTSNKRSVDLFSASDKAAKEFGKKSLIVVYLGR
jgi:3D (Asp-Asp-Asp) domain-containing protein